MTPETLTEDELKATRQRGNIRQKLLYIQTSLRVAKNRGRGHNPNAQVTYEYRNAEDILEAVKPLCAEVAAVVTVDVQPLVVGESVPVEIREVKPAAKNEKGVAIGSPTYARLFGPRFLAIATATLRDCNSGESIGCSAFAEIDFWRKGQTEPEKLCGSADSYASKYALGQTTTETRTARATYHPLRNPLSDFHNKPKRSKQMERPQWLLEMPADEYHAATKRNEFTTSHRLNLFRKCPALYKKTIDGIVRYLQDKYNK